MPKDRGTPSPHLSALTGLAVIASVMAIGLWLALGVPEGRRSPTTKGAVTVNPPTV